LSSKQPETFKKLISENCDIKSFKKDGKVLQEKAEISLKEAVFSETKKTIIKERGLFKNY
jgi:hypothetical protein